MVGALGVEAVAVDHGVLGREAEDTWAGVAFLGEGSGAADFDDGGAEFE